MIEGPSLSSTTSGHSAVSLRRTTIRMVVSGAPSITASAFMLLVPIAGRWYLDDDSYGLWTLASTVVAISLVLDFGAGAWVTSTFASSGNANVLRVLVRPILLTTVGCLSVGAGFAGVWHWYSTMPPFDHLVQVGYVLMLSAGAAAAIRAAFAVICSACLGRRLNRIRGWSLVGQAVASLGLTLVLLHAGVGVFSYVLAVSISSVVIGSVAAWRLAMKIGVVDVEDHGFSYSLRQFAATRGTVTLLGIVVMQVDRWVIGAIGGSETLGVYDIAARLAAGPRLLAISLSTVLIADATKHRRSLKDLRLLLRRSEFVLVAGIVAATLILVGGLAAISRLDVAGGVLSNIPVFMLLSMLLWYGVNGLTASLSLVAIGLGRPQFELGYLIPVAIGTVVVWVCSFWIGSSDLAIYGAGTVLAIGSVVFLLVGPSRLLTHRRTVDAVA